MRYPCLEDTKKFSCSYCGDAPISHFRSFWENAIFVFVDNQAKKVRVPRFLQNFADLIIEYFFRTLIFLRVAVLSSDSSKAHSLRSKVIWEEAERRGIVMEQVIFLGRPLDHYRARLPIKGRMKFFYFESIPIRPEFLDINKNWDDKVALKRELKKQGVPAPSFFELSTLFLFGFWKRKKIFINLQKPLIVKPRMGSRGRHTATNINNWDQFREGINIAKQISPYLVVEEHLDGDICRATLVGGVLAGFYRARVPVVMGNGRQTVEELIEEKNESRPDRVERINISEELRRHIRRSGFNLSDILPDGVVLSLSHRVGRLFGGTTKEMLDELHPSFIPILEKATKCVGLPVVGFDCVIPDPIKDAFSQRWGIIECNTLPFIDLHYYALEGKPKNIAGMIWDLWEVKL